MPELADLGQELGTIAAHLFWATAGVEDFFEQFSYTRFVDHR